jgi:hypothetical protein
VLRASYGWARQRGERIAPRSLLRWARLLLLPALAVAACATPHREDAVPVTLTEQAQVLGIPNARFWIDTQGSAMLQEAKQAVARERAARGDADGTAARPPANYLAVSGGADNGAFGAGLLVGWSETGTRPSFNLVTGVSTGALIAPFAFLGPAYDAQLRAVYTEIGPDDVFQRRWLVTAIFGDALRDTEPLYRLIGRYANANMLAAIAREYARGRLLLIGTTDLDVQRPVIWNIGAIAASGRPEALGLFRKILLASASIPGVFPPVMIDVEVGGQHYQEMHVDGGTVAQTFLIPPQLGAMIDLRDQRFARDRHAYIIRNARLDPEWANVDRRLLTISGRAVATMIHYGGYSDVMRIYFAARRDGIDYNLAYIGADFTVPRTTEFDPSYMRALFDFGYRQALRGEEWHKAPPVFTAPDGRPEFVSP